VARFQRDYNGTQPGDPVKAAAVIIHIASLDESPLRLLLGSDAVHLAEQSDRARMEADRKWRDLSVSTDFRGGRRLQGLSLGAHRWLRRREDDSAVPQRVHPSRK